MFSFSTKKGRGAKIAEALKAQAKSKQLGMNIIPEIVGFDWIAKSASRVNGYAFSEQEEVNDFSVILKATSDWNSSFFHLLEVFNICWDFGDILKVSIDLDKKSRRSFVKFMHEQGYRAIAEGIFVKQGLFGEIMSIGNSVFCNLTEFRSYAKSFITTPSIASFREHGDLPVFLVDDATLEWNGNDGAGLLTAGTFVPNGYQFRYLSDKYFGKGLIARSHYLVKEDKDGNLSLVSYKFDMSDVDIETLKDFIADNEMKSGHSLQVGDVTYWKGAILPPSTLKGKNKKVSGVVKETGNERRLFTIIAMDRAKLRTSNNWQISQLLFALSLASQDASLKALADEFFDLLKKHLTGKIGNLLNQTTLNGQIDLIGLLNQVNGEKYAQLLNMFNTKAKSLYVNMMKFGTDRVILGKFDSYQESIANGKGIVDVCMTRTPNQDATSVQLGKMIDNKFLYKALIDTKEEDRTEDQKEVVKLVLGNWGEIEVENFKSFYSNVICPQIADNILWVSTELQGVVTGDNDGDRNIITSDPLWMSMAKLINSVADVRPVKESDKKLVLKAKVFAGISQDAEIKYLIDNVDNSDVSIAAGMFLTVKNGGQLNVGGITNVAAMATTYFSPKLSSQGKVVMLKWVREYFFACFDVQQTFIDRQKYCYVIPSLRYFHKRRGPISVAGEMINVPGLSFVVAGDTELRSGPDSFTTKQEMYTWFDKEFGDFKDADEELFDFESLRFVTLTDEAQGYTVAGTAIWAQNVLLAFQIAQEQGVNEENWHHVYDILVSETAQEAARTLSSDIISQALEQVTKEDLTKNIIYTCLGIKEVGEITVIPRKALLGWLDSAADGLKRPEHMSQIKTVSDELYVCLFNKHLGLTDGVESVKDMKASLIEAIKANYDSNNINGHECEKLFEAAFVKSKENAVRADMNQANSTRQASYESAREKVAKIAAVFADLDFGRGDTPEEKKLSSLSSKFVKGLLNSQVNSDSRKEYLEEMEGHVKYAAYLLVNDDNFTETEETGLQLEFLSDCMVAIKEADKNADRVDIVSDVLLDPLWHFFENHKGNISIENINELKNKVEKGSIEKLLKDNNGVKNVKSLPQWTDVESALSIVDRLYRGLSFYQIQYGSDTAKINAALKKLVLKRAYFFNSQSKKWEEGMVVEPRGVFEINNKFWAELVQGLLLSGVNLSIKMDKVIGFNPNTEKSIKTSEWVQYFSVMTRLMKEKGIDTLEYLTNDLSFGFGQIISMNHLNSTLGASFEEGEDSRFTVEFNDSMDLAIRSNNLSFGENLKKAIDLVSKYSFHLSVDTKKTIRGQEINSERGVFVPFCFLLEDSISKERKKIALLLEKDEYYGSGPSNYSKFLRKALHGLTGEEFGSYNMPSSPDSSDFARLCNALWPRECQMALNSIRFGEIQFGNDMEFDDRPVNRGGFRKGNHYQAQKSYSQQFKNIESPWKNLKESTPEGVTGEIKYRDSWAINKLFSELVSYFGDKKDHMDALSILMLQSKFTSNLLIGIGEKIWDSKEMDKIAENCRKSLNKRASSKDLRAILTLITLGKWGNEDVVVKSFKKSLAIDLSDLSPNDVAEIFK